MASRSRFFIIHPDGTTTTVDGDELSHMRENGLVGPDDRVIPITSKEPAPIPQANVATSTAPRSFDTLVNTQAVVPPPPTKPLARASNPAEAEHDTAPLPQVRIPTKEIAFEPQIPQKATKGLLEVGDNDFDAAFSKAESLSFYQLKAELEGKDLADVIPSIDVGNTPSKAKAQELDSGFRVRYPDGRIVGPFLLESLIGSIRQGTITKKEEVAFPHTQDFQPILSVASLSTELKLAHPHKPADEKSITHLNEAGVTAALVNLLRQFATGWLFATHDNEVFIVTIVLGHVRNIRSTHASNTWKENLLELFLLEQGEVWFETDPVATSDSAPIQDTILDLCRKATSFEQGFSSARTLKVIGDQNRILEVFSPTSWIEPREHLSQLEQDLIQKAEEGAPIHVAIQELIERGYSAEEVQHALYLLIALGYIVTSTERRADALKEIEQKLDQDFMELVPTLTLESTDEQINIELDHLKKRIWNATDKLPLQDPTRRKLREQYQHIDVTLHHPFERFIALKAHEQKAILTPQLREELELLYLEQEVPKAILQKKYAEIRQSANRFATLASDNPVAIACSLLANYYAASDTEEHRDTVSLFTKATKKYKNSVYLLLAFAEVLIAEQLDSRAQSIITQILKLEPENKEALALRDHLNASNVAPEQLPAQHTVNTLVWCIALTLTLTGALWVLCVDLAFGQKELTNRSFEIAFVIRAVVVTLATLIGTSILHGGLHKLFSQVKFSMTPWGLLLSIVWGMVFGALLDIQYPGESIEIMSYAALVVFCVFDRIYFSLFLNTEIYASVRSKWLGVLCSVVLFCAYQISYFNLFNTDPSRLVLYLGVICVSLALPLAVIQLWTRSVLAPLIYQIAFHGTGLLLMQHGLPEWLVRLLHIG